jgi:hypothetical protein
MADVPADPGCAKTDLRRVFPKPLQPTPFSASEGGDRVVCGHSFSVSSISAINKSFDDALRACAERRLNEPFTYLILDALREGAQGRDHRQPGGADRGGGRRKATARYLTVELAKRELSPTKVYRDPTAASADGSRTG